MSSIILVVAAYLLSWLAIYVSAKALRAERIGLKCTPFYLIYRTARFNGWIDSLSARGRRFWRGAWNIGAVAAPALMAFTIFQLVSNLFNLLYKVEQAFLIQPLIPLPGLTISFETFPYILAAISIALITHEMAHGIASRVDGVPLRSAGLFSVIVGLSGGFVEPDEDSLNKAKTMTKLRVFAAGSTTNAALGLVFLLLLSNFAPTISPFYEIIPSGVIVGRVIEGYPADRAGIEQGEVVRAIDGTSIRSLEDLERYMDLVKPTGVLRIETSRGSYVLRTVPDPRNSSRAFIGIGGLDNYVVYEPKLGFLPADIPAHLLRLELWAALVLISVALINMLPIYQLDGDKYLEALLRGLGVKKVREVRTLATTVCFAILILNFGFSFIRFGFVRL